MTILAALQLVAALLPVADQLTQDVIGAIALIIDDWHNGQTVANPEHAMLVQDALASDRIQAALADKARNAVIPAN
jgi:hypothetical protein